MRGKSSAVHVAYHSVQSAIVVDSMPFGGVKGKIYPNYEVTEKKRSDAVRQVLKCMLGDSRERDKSVCWRARVHTGDRIMV